jgi:hypothetical protein
MLLKSSSKSIIFPCKKLKLRKKIKFRRFKLTGFSILCLRIGSEN